jgi:hypothetical protein
MVHSLEHQELLAQAELTGMMAQAVQAAHLAHLEVLV